MYHLLKQTCMTAQSILRLPQGLVVSHENWMFFFLSFFIGSLTTCLIKTYKKYKRRPTFGVLLFIMTIMDSTPIDVWGCTQLSITEPRSNGQQRRHREKCGALASSYPGYPPRTPTPVPRPRPSTPRPRKWEALCK